MKKTWPDILNEWYMHQPTRFPLQDRCMEHLSNNHKGHSYLHKNSYKLYSRRSIPFWVSRKVNRKRDSNMIRISQRVDSYCRTNSRVRRMKQIQKRRTLSVTGRDLSRKVKHMSKVVWDREIVTKFTRSISSTRIG